MSGLGSALLLLFAVVGAALVLLLVIVAIRKPALGIGMFVALVLCVAGLAALWLLAPMGALRGRRGPAPPPAPLVVGPRAPAPRPPEVAPRGSRVTRISESVSVRDGDNAASLSLSVEPENVPPGVPAALWESTLQEAVSGTLAASLPDVAAALQELAETRHRRPAESDAWTRDEWELAQRARSTLVVRLLAQAYRAAGSPQLTVTDDGIHVALRASGIERGRDHLEQTLADVHTISHSGRTRRHRLNPIASAAMMVLLLVGAYSVLVAGARRSGVGRR